MYYKTHFQMRRAVPGDATSINVFIRKNFCWVRKNEMWFVFIFSISLCVCICMSKRTSKEGSERAKMSSYCERNVHFLADVQVFAPRTEEEKRENEIKIHADIRVRVYVCRLNWLDYTLQWGSCMNDKVISSVRVCICESVYLPYLYVLEHS